MVITENNKNHIKAGKQLFIKTTVLQDLGTKNVILKDHSHD